MPRFTRPALAAVLAAAALTGTACKKEQPAQPGAQPSAPTAQAPSQPAAAPSDDGEPKELKIDDDVVNRYLSYWDQHMELMRQISSEVDTTLKELDEKGQVQGSVQALNRAQEIERKLDTQSAKLRKEFRFDEQQVETLQDFFGTLAVNLQISRDIPVEQMVTGLRAQLAQMPAEQRAAAEQEIAQLESEFKTQSELRELRSEYGDAAVDAALKHKDRIIAMQEKQLKLLGNVHQAPPQP